MTRGGYLKRRCLVEWRDWIERNGGSVRLHELQEASSRVQIDEDMTRVLRSFRGYEWVVYPDEGAYRYYPFADSHIRPFECLPLTAAARKWLEQTKAELL